MVISKRQHQPEQLIVKNELVEQVEKYCYLGSLVNSQWDQSIEIRSRIEKVRIAFNNMKLLLTSKDYWTKIKLAKCYIFSILLYGVKAWIMTDLMMKKLEVFEMWIYRGPITSPTRRFSAELVKREKSYLQDKTDSKKGPGAQVRIGYHKKNIGIVFLEKTRVFNKIFFTKSRCFKILLEKSCLLPTGDFLIQWLQNNTSYQ